MYAKKTQNKNLRGKYIEPLKDSDVCEVSKASAEIMLDRVTNGNEIDFPFS